MYLAERLTSYSLEGIGQYFGERNASDVRFAISAMEREFYGNPRCRAEIEQLQRTIRGPEWDSARAWLQSVCQLDRKAPKATVRRLARGTYDGQAPLRHQIAHHCTSF